MKRIFDVSCHYWHLLLFGLPLLIVTILVKLTSEGPALYWSDRICKNNVIFQMPKYVSIPSIIRAADTIWR